MNSICANMVDMTIVFLLIVIFMSVVIHEVAHGYAAAFLGDLTAKYQDRLTLNPLKHIDPMGTILVPIITSLAGFPFGWAKPVPVNPYNFKNQKWGELIVAAAGPATNIILAVIFGLIIKLTPSLPVSFVVLATYIVFINIGLAVFNLIPIPPLDGSKIFFAFLPQKISQLRWQYEAYVLPLLFIFIFFFSNHLAIVDIYITSFLSGLDVGQVLAFLSRL
jgi:Zn-dependent protease